KNRNYKENRGLDDNAYADHSPSCQHHKPDQEKQAGEAGADDADDPQKLHPTPGFLQCLQGTLGHLDAPPARLTRNLFAHVPIPPCCAPTITPMATMPINARMATTMPTISMTP